MGFLLRKYEARWLVIFGLIVSSRTFYMARFNLHTDYRDAVWGRIMQSLGLAFLFVPISTMAFAFIPERGTNYATGFQPGAEHRRQSRVLRRSTTLLARRAQFHQSVLVSASEAFDFRYREALAGAAAASTRVEGRLRRTRPCRHTD